MVNVRGLNLPNNRLQQGRRFVCWIHRYCNGRLVLSCAFLEGTSTGTVRAGDALNKGGVGKRTKSVPNTIDETAQASVLLTSNQRTTVSKVHH